uniref:ORF2 n=1 Tax=Drosophila melanogaster TaxID=7227 RepID=Q8I7Q3_DROME|nr:ORF2 [Drosophila melanogaster]
MEWLNLTISINNIRDAFDKSYKCINKTALIKTQTLIFHIKVLITQYNTLQNLIVTNKSKLTEEHKVQCFKVLSSFGKRLHNTSVRHSIIIEVPTELTKIAEFDESQLRDLDESQPLEDLDIESDIESIEELKFNTVQPNTRNMANALEAQRAYVKQVSATVPDFDGKKLHLNRFVTALKLTDLTKGDQETLAVEVIKTKIIGPLNYKVEHATTIQAIITILQANVKGESPDVIKAKLINAQQRGKTASQYVTEIDSMRKQLEAAYIDGGLDADNADKFATKESISAMTKNCANEALKMILTAGTFSTFNDAMEKYLHCSTEITGNSNTVLFYNGNNRRGNYNAYYRGRGRNNYNHNYNQNYNQGYNNNNRGRGGYRGHGNNRDGGNRRGNQSQNNNNNRNVRNVQSENSQTPLSDQQ